MSARMDPSFAANGSGKGGAVTVQTRTQHRGCPGRSINTGADLLQMNHAGLLSEILRRHCTTHDTGTCHYVQPNTDVDAVCLSADWPRPKRVDTCVFL